MYCSMLLAPTSWSASRYVLCEHDIQYRERGRRMSWYTLELRAGSKTELSFELKSVEKPASVKYRPLPTFTMEGSESFARVALTADREVRVSFSP